MAFDRPKPISTSSPASFNYAGGVKMPDVTKAKNVFSIVTNTRDSMDYLKGALADGQDCRGNNLKMGNAFFVQSGTCSETLSVDECKGKDRYLYIDNIPKEYPSCANPSQPVDERCSSNKKTGLVPGILMDIAQINPMELLASSMGMGSVVNDRCILRKELVGKVYNEKDTRVYETRCAPEKRPLVCSVDFFENYNEQQHSNHIWTISNVLLLSVLICWMLKKSLQ